MRKPITLSLGLAGLLLVGCGGDPPPVVQVAAGSGDQIQLLQTQIINLQNQMYDLQQQVSQLRSRLPPPQAQ
jgi:hypothetical protein